MVAGAPVIARITGAALGFVLNIVLARSLGVDTYGTWTALSLVSGVIGTVALGGLGWESVRSATQRIGRESTGKSALIAGTCAGAIVGAAGVLVLTIVGASPWPETFDQRWLALTVAALWGFSSAANAVVAERLRGLGGNVWPALLQQAIPSFLMLLLTSILLLALQVDSVPLLGGAQILAFLGALALARPGSSAPVRWPRWRDVGGFLLRGGHTLTEHRYGVAVAMGALVVGAVDVWIVGAVASPRELGQYGAAARVVLLAVMPMAAMQQGLQRFVARRAWGGPRGNVEAVLRATAFVSTAYVGIFVVCVALRGTELMTLVFGGPFQDAAPLVLVLALGWLIDAVTGPAHVSMLMHGAEKVVGKVYIVGAALNIGIPLVVWSVMQSVLWIAIGSAIARGLNSLMLAGLHRRIVGYWTFASLNVRQALLDRGAGL